MTRFRPGCIALLALLCACDGTASAIPHVVLADESGIINAIAISPSGKSIVSCSHLMRDGNDTVRLWSLTQSSQGHPVATAIDARGCNSVAFSPNGETIAAGSEDGHVRLWSAALAESSLRLLSGPTGEVNATAFSPDGSLLAAADGHGAIPLWKLDQLEAPFAILRQSADTVFSMAFSPDGQALATGSQQAGVSLWNVAHAGAGPRVLPGSHSPVVAVRFSRDGRLLAVAERAVVRVWDTRRLDTPIAELQGDHWMIHALAFDPAGETLALACIDKLVRLWSFKDANTRVVELAGHRGGVRSVDFSPDGQTLASAGDDGTILLWQLHSSAPPTGSRAP